MHQRTIGDLATSAVGIGELNLGTAGARGIAADEVERALSEALSRGLSFVDVADDPAAERLAGDTVRALRLRDTAIVATRVSALDAPAARRDVLLERLPPRYVQERVEASLRATRLEVLPLVMISLRTGWLSSKTWPELAGALARLIREGKVQRYGARLDLAAAERDDRLDDELSEAAALGDPFCAMSIVFSACERRGLPLIDGTLRPAKAAAPPPPPPPPKPKAGLILSLEDVANDPLLADPQLAALAGQLPRPPAPPPAAAAPADEPAPPAKRLPILAREPLAGGALAGTIGVGMKRSMRDDRNALDAAALERIAVTVAKLAPLVRDEPPAARSCDAAKHVLERGRRPEHVEAATLAELALRYVLDRGALALPRLHRREHVATAVAALTAPPLSRALHDRIDEIFG